MPPTGLSSPVLVLLLLASASLGAVLGEPAKPWASLPGDQAREAVRECTGPEAWTQVMGGAVDGVMCRSPIGYAWFTQTWQPNVEVSIENTGETAIHNPRVVVGDTRDWGTPEAIVAEATRGYERPEDKARALYEFQRRRRFHACTWDNECSDPVKVYNVYGYTLCGNDATVLSELWTIAGLPVRATHPVGHCVSEVWYGERWHMLDGDEHGIYLLRDNQTIAGDADVARDHDLIKRTHTYGILAADDPLTDQFSASLFGYRGPRGLQRHIGQRSRFDWWLYPGMTMTWRWSHVGKEYSAGSEDPERKDGNGTLIRWGAGAYAKLCNGLITYEPDLATVPGRLAIVSAEGLAEPGGDPALRPAAPGRAQATWRIVSPYVVVGLKVEATALRPTEADAVVLSWSPDGQSFEPIATAAVGRSDLAAVLDERVSPRGKPHYAVWLRAELNRAGEAESGLERLRLAVDVQTSMLSLPELEVGENRVEYRDDGDGPRRVRITQRWVERSAWRPPGPPPGPVHPANGATVAGTKVRFEWQPAPSDAPIRDYWFELSEYPDMRWTLSPNFEKLISRTAQKGTCSYELPYTGLLNPDRTYYWRVRAQAEPGVWGPWSEVWSFRAGAPGVPLFVRLEPTDDGRNYVLRWLANPAGNAPVAYRVYGSDEQGFTAADEPHLVHMGAGFVRTVEEHEAARKQAGFQQRQELPANFIAETTSTELLVAGPGAELPGANSAFYRVVAVDAAGNRSGASDFAELPRPWICTAPVTEVRAGERYEYPARAIRSLSHLTCKRDYLAAFWEFETLVWSLAEAPDWLTVDPATGVLSGTAEAGEHPVRLRVQSEAGEVEQRFAIVAR